MKPNLKNLTTCALMSALMCVLGPLSIPIGPIPISLTNLTLFLSLYLLGHRWGTLSFAVFLLLGAAGLPVFTGMSGGLAKLLGPTGGYLVGYLIAAPFTGWLIERAERRPLPSIAALILCDAVAYFFGTIWFVFQMQCTTWYALTVCVFPFIPVDLLKIGFATVLGGILCARLREANLLPQ